jgi:transposase
MPKEVLHVENSTKLVRLHMAIELSNAKWKVGFCSDGPKLLERNVDAGDLAKVRELICWAKQRLELPEAAQVVSCYEAGREGFMPHRQLEAMGVRNVVVDPASIEVDRRARRKKTDRIDLVKLLANLVRHHQGAKVWSVCRVPTPEQEDARRLHREHQRLTKERTAHQNRMRSLLKLHGITLSVTTHFLEDISALALPFCLHQELEREYRRWQLVNEQMHAIELEQRQRLKQPQTPAQGHWPDRWVGAGSRAILAAFQQPTPTCRMHRSDAIAMAERVG